MDKKKSNSSQTKRPAEGSEEPVRKDGTRRILVVDDNADAARVLSLSLELEGHEVKVAQDGTAALRAARSFRPHVILLDIGLPGVDGYEVARMIREEAELAEVLLLALSGHGHEEDLRRSREAGFDDHLVKPLDRRRFRALIAGLPPT